MEGQLIPDAELADELTGITYDLLRKVERYNEKILETSARIRRTLERVDRHVSENLRLNDLGEIQGLGLELDRAIALRQETYDTLSMLDALPKGATE